MILSPFLSHCLTNLCCIFLQLFKPGYVEENVDEPYLKVFAYRYFSCMKGKDPALSSEMEFDVKSSVSKDSKGNNWSIDSSEIRLWTLKK